MLLLHPFVGEKITSAQYFQPRLKFFWSGFKADLYLKEFSEPTQKSLSDVCELCQIEAIEALGNSGENLRGIIFGECLGETS